VRSGFPNGQETQSEFVVAGITLVKYFNYPWIAQSRLVE
jgi:hypothetical protein